jgi:hypothetical protein
MKLKVLSRSTYQITLIIEGIPSYVRQISSAGFSKWLRPQNEAAILIINPTDRLRFRSSGDSAQSHGYRWLRPFTGRNELT